MSKPVYKYSEEGKFICKYQSTTQAARDLGFDESTIRKAADSNKYSGGFLWKRHKVETNNAEPTYAGPRILILDIETSPLLAMVYQTQVWKARIGHDKVVSDWFILTYSYKWLGEETIYSDRLSGEQALHEDDSILAIGLWNALNEADIVIAHNGDSFDLPNIRTRFIMNGLPPTSSYRQIDTLKIVQKEFGFTHNGLDALAKKFGIPGKIETGFNLWKRCIWGEDAALEEMETYNRHDVEMLELVYLKLRPWIKSHANVSLYNDNTEAQCANCGGNELKPNGFFYTNTGKYLTYQCQSCGAIVRERKTVLSKDKKILVSIPGR